MEAIIAKRVRDYLVEYIGDMTAPGMPIYDAAMQRWRVPVLCKTEKGILPVGEFLLNEAGEFIAVPQKQTMLRILQAQLERLPLLVFGERADLEAQGFEVISV